MTRRPLSVDGLCRCGTPLVKVADVTFCLHCDEAHPPRDRTKPCRKCNRIGGQ